MNCVVIIFSRDRALQLDATLRSFLLHCQDAGDSQIRVLYATSGKAPHPEQYRRLEEEFANYPFLRFVRENDFRSDCIALPAAFDHVCFLVDDNLFVRDFSLAQCLRDLEANPQALGYSLRLGRNTTYCYPFNRYQRPPTFRPSESSALIFRWTDGDLDFGYPLELSSSIYRIRDVLPFLTGLTFSNPNYLEAAMDEHKDHYRDQRPLLLCAPESITFCAPMNKVQSICPNNRVSGLQEYTADRLAQLFDQGYRINVDSYAGFRPNACHQEVEYRFLRSGGNTLPLCNGRPLVSVIIPCYNQAEFLPDAVESVVHQTFTDWECIIVNDGSPDQTRRVARNLIARHPGKRIRLLEKKNGGLADARNAGIAASHGRYILPLDADDVLKPYALAQLVEVLETQSDVAIVYPDYETFGTQSLVIRCIDEHLFMDTARLKNGLPSCSGLPYCSLYRRDVWFKVGGYNPNMILGYEDWDFWIGCIEKGFRARRVPEPLFLYRMKSDSMYSNALKHDAELQARIVLNHSALFDEAVRQRAETVLQAPVTSGLSAGDRPPQAIPAGAQSIAAPSPPEASDSKWPLEVIAHVRQADNHFLNGDLSAARDSLREALVIVPRDPQLIIAYGNVVLRLGDVEGARREFVKTTTLHPTCGPAHLNLAAVLVMLERRDEAECSVRQALIVNPNDVDALKLLGRIYLESGRHVEGVQTYADALRQSPDDAETLLALGKCAVEISDLATAQTMYERALKLAPDNDLARENLEIVKERMKADVDVVHAPVGTSILHSSETTHAKEGRQSKASETKPSGHHGSVLAMSGSTLRAPMVSVIVPTYNRPDTLLDALRSILNQTYQDFEIIVVNDAGSDVENIVRFLDKDDRITYIRHGSNRSLAAARNTGIRVARGKYIAYLDDDDLYRPDHLQTLVTFLEQSECKVAYTDAYRAHQEKRDGRYVVSGRDIPYSFDFDHDRILVHNFVPVLCFMHERACLDAVGLFDESLTTHEDWELWIRLSRRYQFAHIKKVTCEFSSRTDGSTMSSSKLADFRRTYTIILEKYKASAVEKPHIRAAQERFLQSMREKTASTDVATQPAWPTEVIEQVRQADQHLVQGDPPAAAQALSQALQLVPHDPELIVAYGNILLRAGDVEAARREFVKATVLAPKYAPAHSNLAAVLLHLGRAEDAEASARQALALNPADTDSLKVLARVCLDGERFAEAVQAYVAVLRLHPDDVETLLVVGNCYAEAGRSEDATTFYQRVLQLDPGNTVVAENLVAISGNRDASDSATLRADRPSEDPRALSGARSISYEPIASIVIVTYNSASTIRACMESVFSSTRSPIELIVVDNGSTDATRAVLAEYQGRIATLFNAENAGFSRGCNQGIRASSGEYVVLLNPDTVVTPGWLERMKAHFGQDIGAVGPVSDFAAGLQNIDRHLPEGAPSRMGLLEVTDLLARVNHGKELQTRLLTGFCMMIPRRVLDEIGLLDEALFLGNDDLDLSWRLQETGYRLLVATDTFVHHKGQVSFKSAPSEQTSRLVQESTDWLYAKLEAHYGNGNVPPPMELWGINWFRPTEAAFSAGSTRPQCLLTSIIILTHNGLEHTKKCLASIEAQTQEPHLLIIVDNASTDGTLDYLRSYMATHDNVLVVANRTNRGFAAGNNQGLALASGDYVLLLNNDTIVTQGWLRRMVAVLERHPEVGIIGPMSNYVSGPQLVRDASYKGPEGLEVFATEWAQGHDGQSAEATRVVGFCLLTRKEVIARIGGLDERFGSGNFEDDDFCIRAFQVGFRARIALDVFIHHAGSQTFKAAKIDYRQSLMRNWELFKAKWGIPADAPYEKGYRFPSQIPQGSDLSIPLPDVGADHRCEDQGRWWQETCGELVEPIDKATGQTQPAVTEEAPLSVVIVPNGHGLAPLWPSLVQYTKHPLAITILPSHGNGNGADPVHEATCPDGWRIGTSDLSAVRLFNQLLQSAHDDPVILLSSDLILTPGWLKRLLAAFDRDRHIAVVGPTLNQGPATQRVKADYKGTGKALRQFGLRRAHRYGGELAEVDSLAPFCIVFKGSACRPIGPLREDLDLAASLHDYFARLRQAGRKVAVILDTYAHYEPHADLPLMGARRADADP